MAELTEHTETPERAVPFGEGKTLTITREVNPAQLLNEVYDRLGDRQEYNVALQVQEWGLPISEANPAVLHVHPATADMRTVRGAVDTHTPDPHYGMSEEQVELASLKARLAEGDLGNEELNKLLRGIFA